MVKCSQLLTKAVTHRVDNDEVESGLVDCRPTMTCWSVSDQRDVRTCNEVEIMTINEVVDQFTDWLIS